MKANFNILHKIAVGIIFNITIVSIAYCQVARYQENSNYQVYFKNVPAQPSEESWSFIRDLKSPMWTKHNWSTVRPGANFADLSQGVNLKISFADPKNRLNTAYADLRQFLQAGGVISKNGGYTIETVKVPGLKQEVFRLEIDQKRCRILATDLEGIRRGIFNIEDKMLALHGAFLPIGSTEQRPFILRRISRCSFGPIKRFPKMRDELMDTIDYYPDNYLNRLAHQGINGLWLTVEFQDLCTTSFTSTSGKDKDRRLAKLRRTVEKCLKYGIRTYIFCIEPHAWNADDPILKRYPELGGAPIGNKRCFCPSSEIARQYLYQSVNSIFKAVPDLGGIINISHGERATTCLSSISALQNIDSSHKIDCPRCSKIPAWKILYESLSAMEKGMKDAAPSAELISWLYMPQPQKLLPGDSYGLGNWVFEIPAHTPKDVILQFNFESAVDRIEFGKELVGGDYWLSTPGPSSRFEQIAEIARNNKTLISAKIQASTSHEVATVPYVPVPSLLYQKFDAMQKLGVSYSMLSWYFGNYPGIMNKAAGLLSFEPFPSEDSFLNQLALIYWKKEDVPDVVKAWKKFSNGYENYPLTNMFQYYGPMHDGPVWPLLLEPVDATLSPTWQIASSTTLKDWPPSGDRIGECLGDVLTLNETVELCRRMSEGWDSGVSILNKLEPHYLDEPKRILDIGVAKALGIQFRSGYNILHFYALREKMFRMEGIGRLDVLKQMTDIIRDELNLDASLLVLCQSDSRLGFHSEAEGYKYYPAKIKWRMNELRNLLEKVVPEIEKEINQNELLFPEFTGMKPNGFKAFCIPNYDNERKLEKDSSDEDAQPSKQSSSNKGNSFSFRWTSYYNPDTLFIVVSKIKPSGKALVLRKVDVAIESRRLWPVQNFSFPADILSEGDDFQENQKASEMVLKIPLKSIGLDAYSLHPIRMNISLFDDLGKRSSWLPIHPLTPRLELGADNPSDLGWLIFK